jgi:hypothetical protein
MVGSVQRRREGEHKQISETFPTCVEMLNRYSYNSMLREKEAVL